MSSERPGETPDDQPTEHAAAPDAPPPEAAPAAPTGPAPTAPTPHSPPGAVPGWGQQPPSAGPPSTPEPLSSPGSDAIPGWGQQPPGPAPVQPPPLATPGTGAVPGWGQQPAGPAPVQPQPLATPGSGAIPGWGQQPTPPATPPAAPPPPPAQPGGPAWGQQPPPQARPAQPAAPAWGQQAPPPPPGQAPPPPGQPPPGAWTPQPGAPGQPPGTWVQAPPPAVRGSGCLKFGIAGLAIGCGLLLVLLIVLLFAISSFLGLNFFNFLGARGGGPLGNEGAVGIADCSFLPDSRARELFGGNADATDLTGFFRATVGAVLDDRVLPNDPSCWVTDGQKASLARIAIHQGGDAGSVYAAEKQKAQPSSQDQGNGITIENPGYFAGDVAGLGDEAFCTDITLAGAMSGVVVHKGDRVVYVSVGPPESSNVPDFSQRCPTAQEIARALIG
jgi:hypothetical protein